MSKWIWKKYNATKHENYKIVETSEIPSTMQSSFNGVSIYRDVSVDANGKIVGENFISNATGGEGYSIEGGSVDKWYKCSVGRRRVEYKYEYFTMDRRRIIAKKIINYSQGSYIGEVTADYDAYTNNARNSDGYWYVRDREANQAPRLIGDFKDLGTRNGAFSIEFQVDDQDTDQALKATIRLNGSQIKVFENMTRRQSYEINITNELLKDLEFNKRNTINISLTDNNVTVEENFYFTKTNRPPEITVSNSNLGTQNKEFKITFSATDPDGDAMTAKIYIDGVQVEDLGAITAGQEKAYSIKREDFITLKNGEHKIRIDVTDAEGSQSSRFITFTKMVTWYLYEYTEELGNRAIDIRVDMLTNLAEGIIKKIEVCNNALDTNPTWETIEEGKWVKFANTTKTAAKWGLGVRVRVDRGAATQDSYIYGFNISYA